MNVSLSAPMARAADTTTGGLAALITSGQASPQVIGSLNAEYGLRVDPERTASIAAEHRLVTVLPE